MTLSRKSIQNLLDKPEHSIWNYIIALQHLQNVLFELEKEVTNPEVLQDLSIRALEVGKEIEAILVLLEERMEE